jgi:hypothetical protein
MRTLVPATAVALMAAAASVAAAILLSGILHVSSAPMLSALSPLAR